MNDLSKISDENLAKKSVSDLECFAEIVDRFERRLQRYIMRISAVSELEAEEILQEVFLAAWRSLRGFNSALKFSSWIYRIAHNKTISYFRQQRSSTGGSKTVSLSDDLFDISFRDDEMNLGAEFDRAVSARKVHEILDLLPFRDKEVLVLRFLEDKSYIEIADILHKPISTVGTLIKRAKQKFREIFKQKN